MEVVTLDNYSVYKHINKQNDKVYIGITMLRPEIRWGKNGQNYKECPYFWNAIQKYGWDSFEHIIVETGLTREEAAQREIDLIEECDSRNPAHGYNISVGGYSQPGELNPFYGHTHSQETKDKVAASNRRRVWTKDARRRVREKNSGANSKRARAVLCVETGVVYPTLTEAAKAMNVSIPKISDVLAGRHKTCGGFHWQYAS